MTLVREFAANQSEPAFAALVERHIGLIHSAALRQVGDAHLAEDITQAVFVVLARKAASLGLKTVLSAWLYRTTRYAAADALKARRRRAAREQEAYMQSSLNSGGDAPSPSTSEEIWAQLAPLLDDAMAELGETDRTALVLRFFENKTAREIAEALRMEEAAAQKRVTRALEKLRAIFVKRGVTLTATVIAGAVAANSVQAAPAGLAVAITAAAAKGATISASVITLVKGTMKMMTWIKLKTAIVLGAATLVVGGTATVAFTDTNGNAIVHPKVVSTTKHETTVIGLVNLDDFKAALLEFLDRFPNHANSITSREFVREGQSFEDRMVKDAHVKIEIVQIDFANGVVEAREDGKDMVYHFNADEKSNGGLKVASLRLNDFGFDAVFDLYAEISRRTLLVHQAANSKFPVVVAANPRNKAEAIQSLESVLSEKGFAVIPDGNKFEQVLPSELAKNANPHSTTVTVSKAEDNAVGWNINFQNVPFEQVRDFYAQLSGRQIVQEGVLPAVTISLHTRNSLTKPELLYAMDVLLGWQGIKIVNVDEKTSKAIWAQAKN